MITIFVRNFEFDTIIGILSHERLKEQRVVVSASFRADEFIDYSLVCNLIRNEMIRQKFYKVEDALEYFVDFFKQKFTSLNYLFMEIIKPDIIPVGIVGVSVEKYFISDY